MELPLTPPQKPYWKWQAIACLFVIGSLIAYLGMQMAEHIENTHQDFIIACCIFVLLVAAVFLVFYIQEPQEFHSWLDAEDQSLSRPLDIEPPKPKIRKRAEKYGKKKHDCHNDCCTCDTPETPKE